MWRLPLALVLLWLMVASAAADPVKHPNARTYTVTCTTGGGEMTFDVVGTGAAGHDFGSNSIAVLLSGTTTTFVNGVETNQVVFDHPEWAPRPCRAPPRRSSWTRRATPLSSRSRTRRST